ncbi:MAG: CopG family antitoxin [Steroidobacteraceae bacterium]
MSRKAPKLKPVPDFATEAEEREFWLTHDTTEYVDWSNGERVTFPNLKPSDTRQPGKSTRESS